MKPKRRIYFFFFFSFFFPFLNISWSDITIDYCD